jgi:hypothetical protein
VPLNLQKLFALPAFVVVAVFVVSACGGDDDAPKQSGVAQVDEVIEVVESGDRERLQSLLQFTSLPCTVEPGVIDRPRCLDEAAGTNVDVLQATECETGWLRQDDIDRLIEDVIVLEPVVYAAFESPDNFYMPGRYTVVFEGDETRVDEDGLKRYLSMGVEADNGLVTGVALGCSIEEPVHFLLPHLNEGFDDWLIEPRG